MQNFKMLRNLIKSLVLSISNSSKLLLIKCNYFCTLYMLVLLNHNNTVLICSVVLKTRAFYECALPIGGSICLFSVGERVLPHDKFSE